MNIMRMHIIHVNSTHEYHAHEYRAHEHYTHEKANKSETELTAGVLKKLRPKTHKRLKERFFIGRIRTKRVHFRGSPLFQTTYKNKQTINSIYLVSPTDVSLVPFSVSQPPSI